MAKLKRLASWRRRELIVGIARAMFVPWSAATVGAVEALRDDDTDKNRLCPPLTFSGDIADTLAVAHAGMTGLIARSGERDLVAWNAGCRLGPARAAAERADDPDVGSAFAAM